MSVRLGRSFATAILVAIAATVGGPAHAAGPVRLKPMPPIVKGIAAFPRVVGGTSRKTAERVNRALATAEQGLGCTDHSGPNTYWNRRTFASMRGPRYLSLRAYDDFYCGGPYPDTDQVTLVFDLRIGAPIDWKQLFPAGLIQAAGTGPGGGDSEPVTVSSAALWKLYAKAAAADLHDKDCAKVLANASDIGTGLVLWPDAETDALGIQQADFPHVVEACGPPEIIHMPELRKLGANAAFRAALDEAHWRGWYDKPAK